MLTCKILGVGFDGGLSDMRAATEKYVTKAQSSRIRRILDAARHLLEEVGVERMTMRDLATASGVANATLYNRFGTKDNIIVLAVIDHYEESIRSGMSRVNAALPPVQKLIHGLRLFDEDIRTVPAFTRALMSAYFKLDGSREMPNVLYKAAYDTWMPILREMKHGGALKPWVSVDLLCEEICDRLFAVVMKWSQSGFPERELFKRLTYSILSTLLAASTGRQTILIDEQIRLALATKPKARRIARKSV